MTEMQGLRTTSRVTTSSSDAQLISAIRAGDLRAYGILYQRHCPAADRAARQIAAAADVDGIVAKAFAGVLGAIKRGGGPVDAFRPYLITSVRQVARERQRCRPGQVSAKVADLPDPGATFLDPAVARSDGSLITQAFMTLPERWAAVLWHTEIEQAKPTEVAVLLGLTQNGVATLSYRAREGLRQAYLRLYLSDWARAECRPLAAKLAAHVRGGLSKRDASAVESHVRGCADCREVRAELAAVNAALRDALGPAFLRADADRPCAAAVSPDAATAAQAGGGRTRPGRRVNPGRRSTSATASSAPVAAWPRASARWRRGLAWSGAAPSGAALSPRSAAPTSSPPPPPGSAAASGAPTP
jgi:RNA polymerase sigma factor (sigma-70 family)